MLGPGRLALYQRGVPLGAMAELYTHPVWGPSSRGRNLADITANPSRV